MKTTFHFSLAVAVLIISTALILLLPLVHTAEAANPIAPYSWVNVDIPYFGAQSIEVKITWTTPGNNLKEGMGIYQVYSQPGMTMQIQRGIAEATYSTDLNSTTFTYGFSSAEPDVAGTLKPFGVFPNDGWSVTVIFYTAFLSSFTANPQYGIVPSPYYYLKYTTTYSNNDSLGYEYYNLNLEILHPSTFPSYVNLTFYTPIVLLSLLAFVFTVLLVIKRKDIGQFFTTLVTVCSAVIVFLPIFHLSTQALETPFEFTSFDSLFLILLGYYVFLLAIATWTEICRRKRFFTNFCPPSPL